MADRNVSIQKLKVGELRELCKTRGLPITGNKTELVDRLLSSSDDFSLADDLPADEDDLLKDDDEIDEEADCENLLIDDNEIEENKSTELSDLSKDTEMNKLNDEVTVKPNKIILGSVVKKPDDGIKILTKEEILQRRASKFGSTSDDAKKKARAERFGTSLSNISSEKTEVDVDVLKKRAERFGQVVSSTLLQEDLSEKILKRKQRFGEISTSDVKTKKVSTNSNNDLLKKRAARFGIET